MFGVTMSQSEFTTRLDAPFGVFFIPTTPLSFSAGSWTLAFHMQPLVNISQIEVIEELRQRTARDISTSASSVKELLSIRTSVVKHTLDSIKHTARNIKSIGVGTNQYRGKRGLIDGIGQVGEYLFGVATSEEVNRITQEMDRFLKGEERVIHIESHLLSVANETASTLLAQRRVLQEVLSSMQDLETFEIKLQSSFEQDQQAHRLANTLSLLEEYTENMQAQVMGLLEITNQLDKGLLPQSLVSLGNLSKILTEITWKLPASLQMAIPPTSRNLHYYYDLPLVRTLTLNDDSVLVILRVPLIPKTPPMLAFQVISIPIPITTTQVAVQAVQSEKRVFLVQENSTEFVVLSEKEYKGAIWLESCGISESAQPRFYGKSHQCIAAVFFNDSQATELCQRVVRRHSVPHVTRIDHRKYVISTAVKINIHLSCAHSPSQSKIVEIEGVNLLEIPKECGVFHNTFSIPASFSASSRLEITGNVKDIKIPSSSIMSPEEQTLIQRSINTSKRYEQSAVNRILLELNHLSESGIPLEKMLEELKVTEKEDRSWTTSWKIRGHIQTHWPYILTIIVLIGGVSLSVLLYKKRTEIIARLRKFRRSSKTRAAEVQSIPLLPTALPAMGQPSAPIAFAVTYQPALPAPAM